MQFNYKQINWCKTKVKLGYLLKEDEVNVFLNYIKDLEDRYDKKFKEVEKLKKVLKRNKKEKNNE
jgi:hypothetical protein